MSNTFLTTLSTDDYLPGVFVLYESIKLTNTRYQFTVMLTGNVSEQTEKKIKDYGIETIRISKQITIPEEVKRKNIAGGFSRRNNNFNKLFMFELVQFDKIVYLDCDMLVLENIDSLFDKQHLSAVVAGKSYPGNGSWTKLNAGLIVIVPEIGIVQKFIDVLPSVINKEEFFGDQAILQEYYCNWESNKELELNERYNVFFGYLSYYTAKLGYKIKSKNENQNIAIVHFVGETKPWMKNVLCLPNIEQEILNYYADLLSKTNS